MMDTNIKKLPAPILHTLPPVEGKAGLELLKKFRAQLGKTVWGADTPDTMIGPVQSDLGSLREFESSVQYLYTALLKILLIEQQITRSQMRHNRISELLGFVRRLNTWPVMNEGKQVDIAELLENNPTRFLFGRPDVVLGADGPKVVETNFDTGIGGYLRPDDIWKIAADVFPMSDNTLMFGSPLDGFARYYSEFAGDDAVDFHWIMKNTPKIRRELDIVIQNLNSRQDKVFHQVHYTGDTIPAFRNNRRHYLHRACSIYTVKSELDKFTAMLQTLVPLTQGETAPLYLSVLDSKLMLAWISDPELRPGNLSRAERDAVDALIPWTRVLAFLSAQDLAEVRTNREEFVIKKTDSFQARDVHLGWNTTQTEWEDLIRQLKDRPAWDGTATDIWIVQRRVRPRPHELFEYTDQGTLPRSTGVSCCPYMMGGKLRGLESWVTPFSPDFSMIHKMQFVPHFVSINGGLTG